MGHEKGPSGSLEKPHPVLCSSVGLPVITGSGGHSDQVLIGPVPQPKITKLFSPYLNVIGATASRGP